MSLYRLSDYAARIERDLRHNILPFWLARVPRRENHGFLGAITNDLTPDPTAERGALLTMRILWTFSAAYRRYRDSVYLEIADYAYNDLMAHFHDRKFGGFWWSIAADGSMLRDRKQIYGQAFAIYALQEYYAVTNRPEILGLAIATFRLIEQHGRDRAHGGYFEAFSREWSPTSDWRLSEVDMNEPKSQNTHIHVLEAYTPLLRAWPDLSLRDALRDLVEIMTTRIIDPVGGHLRLFFSENWTSRIDKISYGHDIETSWLLTEASAVLNEPELTRELDVLSVKMASATLAEGIDSDGGVFNSGASGVVTDTNKEWWPQTEAIVGFLNAYRISKEPRFLEAALRSWDFIENNLIDHQYGEWLRGVTKDGRPLEKELKVGFWKCPYHNGRAALEAMHRLNAIV